MQNWFRTISGFTLRAILGFGGSLFQGFRFRLEGRTWRLSLVQDMAPSTTYLSLYQAAQTNRHHRNHLVMAHTRLGFLGLFVLAPELLSVSFLSGFCSVGLSDLQAFKCEDLFSCVKMAQGKFLH